MDIEKYNADWLAAWTAKDTASLLTFYAEDVVYKDGQVPGGLTGQAALGAYLNGLFAATPPMAYIPDEVWPIPGGFCGRWNCQFELPDGTKRSMRGFDLCLVKDGRITLNEVYTHNLPA